MEYAKDYENGLCVKRNALHLMNANIELIDNCFGVKRGPNNGSNDNPGYDKESTYS